MSTTYEFTDKERAHLTRLAREIQDAVNRLTAIVQFIGEREELTGVRFDLQTLAFVPAGPPQPKT